MDRFGASDGGGGAAAHTISTSGAGITATPIQPDISDRATRLLGHVVDDLGIADTVVATGLVVTPAAGAAIAATPALAPGTYRIIVQTRIAVAATLAELRNFELRRAGVTLYSGLLSHDGAFGPTLEFPRVTIPAGAPQTLSLNATAAGGAGSNYFGMLAVTLLR